MISLSHGKPRRPRRGAARDESGIALIIALLFVVLLTVLVVEFSYEMQVDASLIERYTNSTAAYMSAKSSIARSRGVNFATR